MTNGTHGASARLSYLKIRDVTTKDEEANGASTYVAVLPATEILKIGTDGNLRSYIPSHEGKKRNLVHKAIGKTIRDNADRFTQLNSGFLVGASKISIDDNKKTATLWDPSVNNGAQSQGEIQLYVDECQKAGLDPIQFAVRVELSIEPDAATRTQIAVARNTSTKIEGISIAGKFGYFTDLNKAFRESHPDRELATSETNVEEHYVDTLLLLQILWALMPEAVRPEQKRSIEARMRAYKNAAFCLQDFINIADGRKSKEPKDAKRAEQNEIAYRYFVDMAGAAWTEYLRWKKHPDWNDKRLLERLGQGKRDDGGVIKEVSDGIVFPILSAMSRFVKQDDAGVWRMTDSGVRDEHFLIGARRQLKECGGRPMLMGRSGGAYEALLSIAEMAEEMTAAHAIPAE